MTQDFAKSNLSKIKPKLRTQGNITGNFGKVKVKSGSSLRDIGDTTGSVGHLPTKTEYLNRLRKAYEITTDLKLKKFIYEEIRKILIQSNQWKAQ